MNRFSRSGCERARAAAHAAGEYVGQESFMGAGEIRLLAGRAGIAAATSVLDLCCGSAGPGLLIARELGCIYLGVDSQRGAIEVARERAARAALPVPGARRAAAAGRRASTWCCCWRRCSRSPTSGRWWQAIADALEPGGRFAFTLEEGEPLTEPSASRCRTPTPSG